MSKQTGFAIKSEHGLYTGWWLMKRDAIKEHSELFEESWVERRKKGDRCVRIEISELKG